MCLRVLLECQCQLRSIKLIWTKPWGIREQFSSPQKYPFAAYLNKFSSSLNQFKPSPENADAVGKIEYGINITIPFTVTLWIVVAAYSNVMRQNEGVIVLVAEIWRQAWINFDIICSTILGILSVMTTCKYYWLERSIQGRLWISL